MYKLMINRKDAIPIDKIYAIERKKWGSIWIRYTDENGIKKISKTRDNFREFVVKVKMFRIIHEVLGDLKVKDQLSKVK